MKQQYQYPLQSINPQQHLIERQAPTIIVHDKADKFAKFAISEQLVQQSQWVELKAAEGYEHNRIMKSDEVMQAFNHLVKKSSLN
ncbi:MULTISPECIES: hypothetical protein [Vibrio]|uniref:Alpha/beta hydrolase n=1 Tax=Vibrio casei TaxID=673372 RepID=A0A368LIK2_9VIBR|nr:MULTISPECIES: hypothetical protein [Vibrio]RCS70501.1 hypothetical protein CIK83_13825 [Vibrio casei]SJN27967.1 Predicted hydrolase or acyltransferase [Vibrio casei]HBV77906.1 hypothetical protein [Vibrio sp.]